MPVRGVSFNGNSMQTFDGLQGIYCNDIDMESLPNKTVSKYPLANSNNSIITHVDYPDRDIPINGKIIAQTPAALDALIKAFKGYFIGSQKNLDIDYDGSIMRFVATLDQNSGKIKRPNGLQYATFDFSFTCKPFGQDTASSPILSFTGRTSSAYVDAFTFGGTAPAQQPVITITYTGLSSTGSQQLVVGNNSNGQSIIITRSTWTTGDVVSIDVPNEAVYINGVLTDYIGAFPEFLPGAGNISYADTFTSRTFNISAIYFKRWL
jgi:hypothetical protein